MYNQSISGIRSNLEAFIQAAAKIAQPQTTEESLSTRDEQTTRIGESADESNARNQALTDIDQSREMINMMMAQKGVEANLGVLKTAMSLSGQTVDILA